jgi:hypothetical protein
VVPVKSVPVNVNTPLEMLRRLEIPETTTSNPELVTFCNWTAGELPTAWITGAPTGTVKVPGAGAGVGSTEIAPLVREVSVADHTPPTVPTLN